MAFGLFAASCNNDKKPPRDDDKGNTTKDKDDDDYNNGDDDDDNGKNRDDDDDDNGQNGDDEDDNKGGNWSSADKRSWMKMCSDPLKEQMGSSKATNYCECVMDKISEKYSSFSKANTQGTEEEGMELGRECIKELGYQ